MSKAIQYRMEQDRLLIEYEEKVRKWLADNGEEELAEKIPFFRDGVTCPEKWFSSDNGFRPLFILKEVSLGMDNVSEVNDFLKIWGNQKTFDFVENPFDDVKIGKFILWRKIAALAKGLEEVYQGMESSPYGKYDFSYKSGGEKYNGDIEGYRQYYARTSNRMYNDIIDKIAVLETKKIGGGRSVASELSVATKYFSEHIAPFKELICREIALIDPTVIICCSREFSTYNLFSEIKKEFSNVKWIDGYHMKYMLLYILQV